MRQKKNQPTFPPDNLSAKDIVWFRQTLIRWGRRHYRDFPWRSEHFPFHCLIAEILLQRTRAEQVVPVFQQFKSRFPDADSLCNATEEEIFNVIKSLGLAWRSRFLKSLGCGIKNKIPEDLEGLLKLPGVGPYAAGAYLSLHRGERATIVDSNVVRFYGRYFGFQTDPETRRSRMINELADMLTPKKAFRSYNYALLDFCALVCTPKPLHGLCPLKKTCVFVRGLVS